jgi:hypothetical protein
MLCFCQDGITMVITTSNPTRYSQLFVMGSSKPEAWQNITRKVNGDMIQVYVAESKLRELTEDLRDNWDTTYSVNLFPPSKEFEGKKIELRTDIYFEQILVMYKE